MTKLFEVYKCEVCGNITKVVHASGGTLVCCGKPMILQQEKTADAGKEKHVPVVEKSAKGIIVKIGSVPHPMEEKHYIEWVEVRTGKMSTSEGLNPAKNLKQSSVLPIRMSRHGHTAMSTGSGRTKCIKSHPLFTFFTFMQANTNRAPVVTH
ncbi:MAG: desulfoferrodoxin FeS4 iron-binding domain-containing protein [Marinilabiliales bacterium]|nr:desulfoferrodoxin FeS4 iron-binding domain-containing protein [Marinilabiliales bacterium]